MAVASASADIAVSRMPRPGCGAAGRIPTSRRPMVGAAIRSCRACGCPPSCATQETSCRPSGRWACIRFWDSAHAAARPSCRSAAAPRCTSDGLPQPPPMPCGRAIPRRGSGPPSSWPPVIVISAPRSPIAPRCHGRSMPTAAPRRSRPISPTRSSARRSCSPPSIGPMTQRRRWTGRSRSTGGSPSRRPRRSQVAIDRRPIRCSAIVRSVGHRSWPSAVPA